MMIIIIVIILLTDIGLSPGGCGYFTCKQNMKFVTTKFKSEGLHEKHVPDLKTQFVPRSKHSVWVIKTGKLVLYIEIIAVCSEIHAKHINALCGQNTEHLNVKAGDKVHLRL